MKTILNVKFDGKVLQVPANYIFSDRGVHFFIHRKILQAYQNDTVEYSEKLWTVAEYKTGVCLKSNLAKKNAKADCTTLIAKYGILTAIETLSKHDVINFEVEQVLSFAEKQVPPPAKNLVLGKYFIDAPVVAAAEKTFKSEHRTYKFNVPLSEAKTWVKFANEVVLLPGYAATMGTSEKNSWDMVVIKHDRGSYQFPLETDIPELRKVILEAFNVDGAGEHLRPTAPVKRKATKAKVQALDPEEIEVEVAPMVIGTEIIEADQANAIELVPPSKPATWTNRDGISIELPDTPSEEKSSWIQYEPPAGGNRMYIDRAGILWEFTATWETIGKDEPVPVAWHSPDDSGSDTVPNSSNTQPIGPAWQYVSRSCRPGKSGT